MTTTAHVVQVGSLTIPARILSGLKATIEVALEGRDIELNPDARHYATFGLRYEHEVHPTLGFADPKSSIRVQGVDEETARAVVHAVTDGHYAFLYSADRFNHEFHPMTPILEVVVY